MSRNFRTHLTQSVNDAAFALAMERRESERTGELTPTAEQAAYVLAGVATDAMLRHGRNTRPILEQACSSAMKEIDNQSTLTLADVTIQGQNNDVT